MLAVAIAFLKSPLGKYLLIGLACIAIVLAFGAHERGVQKASDAKLAVKVKAASDLALATCHSNVQALSTSLAAQNAAVDALRAESEARLAKSAKAVQGARAVAESYRQSAAAVLGAKAGVDACRSADSLIAESVR